MEKKFKHYFEEIKKTAQEESVKTFEEYLNIIDELGLSNPGVGTSRDTYVNKIQQLGYGNKTTEARAIASKKNEPKTHHFTDKQKLLEFLTNNISNFKGSAAEKRMLEDLEDHGSGQVMNFKINKSNGKYIAIEKQS